MTMLNAVPEQTDPPANLPAELSAMSDLVDELSRPNINALWSIKKDLDLIKWNLKHFGYEMARQLAAALPLRTGLLPQNIVLACKPSTQADLESDWVAYWASELRVPVIFHRKLWELAYVLQVLHQRGLLVAGKRGLGFGCGTEPLSSYFAARGVSVTATDQPPEASASQGWQATSQHATSIGQTFHPHLVDHATFDALVKLDYIDMNALPSYLRNFDFNWSVCAFEHLGSIERGLSFVENALATLRPGGTAVHTTEFNFLNDDATIDNWPTVLFQKRHFEELKQRLELAGHWVAPLDFDVGNMPLDRFIDLPPYVHDWSAYTQKIWDSAQYHVKLGIDGFASTCFGIIVQKAP